MTLIEKGYSIRFAEAKDSGAFVKWAMDNPAIDPRDIADSLKENNPRQAPKPSRDSRPVKVWN